MCRVALLAKRDGKPKKLNDFTSDQLIEVVDACRPFLTMFTSATCGDDIKKLANIKKKKRVVFDSRALLEFHIVVCEVMQNVVRRFSYDARLLLGDGLLAGETPEQIAAKFNGMNEFTSLRSFTKLIRVTNYFVANPGAELIFEVENDA
jgi:hypothetical protein